jgi:peroxiredoxin
MSNLTEVDWSQLPVPPDDGAARHLCGSALAAIALPATDGRSVTLAGTGGRSVVYAYPMTARPGTALPDDWDMIPGARGCTPQACAFRDHFAELTALGVTEVFGLSVQDGADQREAATRLHLPFALLSDAGYRFTEAMRLPTFTVAGMLLLRRLTMIIRDGRIEHVIYPVFPPDANARAVIDLLKESREPGSENPPPVVPA